MLLPDSMKKEYEQSSVLLFVFRQVKPALWKAPLTKCFLFWRCHPDLNRGIEVLQTFALPLGYGTIFRTEVLYHGVGDLSMLF